MPMGAFQLPEFQNDVKKDRKTPEARWANEGLLEIIWYNSQNISAITSLLVSTGEGR